MAGTVVILGFRRAIIRFGAYAALLCCRQTIVAASDSDENLQQPSSPPPDRFDGISLSDLPQDVVVEIMKRLEPRSLAQLAVSSKDLWSMASSMPHWTYMTAFDVAPAVVGAAVEPDLASLIAQLPDLIRDCAGLQRPSQFLTFQQIAILYNRLFADEYGPDRFRALPYLVRTLNLPELYLFAVCHTNSFEWIRFDRQSQVDDLLSTMQPLVDMADNLHLDLSQLDLPGYLSDVVQSAIVPMYDPFSAGNVFGPVIAGIRSVFPTPFTPLFPFNDVAARATFEVFLRLVGSPDHPLTNPKTLVSLIKIGVQFHLVDIAKLELDPSDPRLPALFGLAQITKAPLGRNWSKPLPLLERYSDSELVQVQMKFAECLDYWPVLSRVPCFVDFLRRHPDQLYALVAVGVRAQMWEWIRLVARQRRILDYPQFCRLAGDLAEILQWPSSPSSGCLLPPQSV